MSQEQGLGGASPGPAPAAPWSSPDDMGDGERGPAAGNGRFAGPAVRPAEQPDLGQRQDGIPLRPLGLGDLLDGTFTTIRRNPRATVGLAAVLVTVQQVLSVGVDLVTNGLPTLGGFEDQAFSFQAIGGFGGIIGTLLAAVVGAVLTGMLVVVVSDDVIGRRASAGDVWRRVRPRLWALLLAAAIAGITPYLGLVFLVVPGLALWALFALTTPALVLEGLGPFAAIARSCRLAAPSLIRVWCIRALSVLLATLMQLLIVVPFEVAGAIVVFASDAETDSAVAVVVLALSVLGSIIAGTLTAPFLAGVLALMYIDRRMRAEGLDLVLRRQQRTGGGAAPAAVRPVAGATP
jgi:hypothetical protein